jgi:hypothetical protein
MGETNEIRVRLSCTSCGVEWNTVSDSMGHTCKASREQLVKFAEMHRCESNIKTYSDTIREVGSHPYSEGKVAEYRSELFALLSTLSVEEMALYGQYRLMY